MVFAQVRDDYQVPTSPQKIPFSKEKNPSKSKLVRTDTYNVSLAFHDIDILVIVNIQTAVVC